MTRMRWSALAITLIVAIACGGPQPTAAPSIEGVREVRAEVGRAAALPADDSSVPLVVAADSDFALRLYRLLARDAPDNLFYSPYSVSTALSMTYAGARGDTATQMAEAIGINLHADNWHAGRNSIELQLAADRPVASGATPLKLEPTNAIFGQDGFAFEAEYLRILAADYGAGLQTVDFVTRAEAARGLINSWVNARTNDRIAELLPERSVDELTRVVLVTAIYFKATWLDQFSPEATNPQPFTRLDGSPVSAEQMHGQLMTSYAAGDGWQAVRLPYAGNASMMLIVPDAGQFATVEGSFDGSLLADALDRLGPAEVTLDMPKWESSTAIDLVPTLKAAGVTDLFDPNSADLSGIAAVPGLHVAAALHQANITVDEEGTEAAAATAVVVGPGSAPVDRVTLSIDRPFLYLITDDVTGEILFVGRVLDPTAG